jgi:hypothetical protein
MAERPAPLAAALIESRTSARSFVVKDGADGSVPQ